MTPLLSKPFQTLTRLATFCAALLLLLPALLLPARADEASYRIQPGDVLQLEVLEDGTLGRALLVLPDGTVSVPSGGVVKAAGLSLPEAQSAITAALAPNFAKTPTVYLSIGQLNPAAASAVAASGGLGGAGTTVFLMGEVAKPGSLAVPRGTTLLQLLAESGGLTPFAATRRIQLRRIVAGTEKIWIFDYAAVMAGKPAPVLALQKGDVILVPTRRLFE